MLTNDTLVFFFIYHWYLFYSSKLPCCITYMSRCSVCIVTRFPCIYTRGGGGGMSHWGLYIILVNHFLKSTLNEDEVLNNFDTLYQEKSDPSRTRISANSCKNKPNCAGNNHNWRQYPLVLRRFGRSHRFPTVTIGPRFRFVGTGIPMKIM